VMCPNVHSVAAIDKSLVKIKEATAPPEECPVKTTWRINPGPSAALRCLVKTGRSAFAPFKKPA